jgi:hypothetical protein
MTMSEREQVLKDPYFNADWHCIEVLEEFFGSLILCALGLKTAEMY